MLIFSPVLLLSNSFLPLGAFSYLPERLRTSCKWRALQSFPIGLIMESHTYSIMVKRMALTLSYEAYSLHWGPPSAREEEDDPAHCKKILAKGHLGGMGGSSTESGGGGLNNKLHTQSIETDEWVDPLPPLPAYIAYISCIIVREFNGKQLLLLYL